MNPADAVDRVKHCLRTAEGRQVYVKRKCTVEPTFGIIEPVLAFREFPFPDQARSGKLTHFESKRLPALGDADPYEKTDAHENRDTDRYGHPDGHGDADSHRDTGPAMPT